MTAVVLIGLVGLAALGVTGALLFARSTEARQLDYPVNQARLAIAARTTGEDHAEIAVTFTPTVESGHFYGTSMPRGGIDGAGRPTLVELVGADWSADGPVVESATARDQVLPGFSAPFQLYPDGPVTLRLPIRRVAAGSVGPVRVALTFMVCTTSGVCFPPVERAVVDVLIAR